MPVFDKTKTIKHENWEEGCEVVIRPLKNKTRAKILSDLSARFGGKPADQWPIEQEDLLKRATLLACVVSWTWEGEECEVDDSIIDALPGTYVDFIFMSIFQWGKLPEGGQFLG